MREFKKIVVVGAGTMGHGIAQTFASYGYDTVCIDTFEKSIATAKVLVPANVNIMLENGFITQEQADNTTKYLRYSSDYADAKDADLCIEAVPEVKEIKAGVYENLDKVVRPDTIISSTTSAANIFAWAKKVSHPERLIITHFNNPSHIVPLVEIVVGPKTSEENVKDIRALIEKIGRKPAVLNKYVPGFIVNRLTAALLREASYMVDKGWVSMEDVDTAFSCNQALKAPFEGPIELMDYIGWDVAKHVGTLLYPFLSRSMRPSKLAKQMVKENRLGVKTGVGVKNYAGKTRADLQAKRNDGVMRVLKATEDIVESKAGDKYYKIGEIEGPKQDK
ncbi:MAG: 3-hydroxyacyl-CoA dehydrogenase family protein [Clostridia bacterium]|nr:3-hydroxyacyl-CoA dehydrogenase family protein [Clostridia bacterium]